MVDSLKRAISIQMNRATLENRIQYPAVNKCAICGAVGHPTPITDLDIYAREIQDMTEHPKQVMLVGAWLCDEHLIGYRQNLIDNTEIIYNGLVALHRNPLSIPRLPDTIKRVIVKW